jgi:RHS repeat-associated protein
LGGKFSLRRSGSSYFYVPDYQGNTRQLVNSSQAVTDTLLTDAWGREITSSLSIANPFQAFGQWGYYRDTASRHYVEARHLDVVAGRWISQDPIGFEGGDVNLYRYVGNNPVRWLDPVGLELVIGPRDHPYFIFTWEGVVKGVQTGAAALAHEFTFHWYDSSPYQNEPGYAESAVCASIAKGALECAATAGGVEAFETWRAGRAINAALAQARASVARRGFVQGRGRYGWELHKALEKELNALGRYNVRAEVTYQRGKILRPVGKYPGGSARLDVVIDRTLKLGKQPHPKLVLDLKTGTAKLEAEQIDKIRANLPKFCSKVRIREMTPEGKWLK